MSRRTFRDYLLQAFVARDKATFTQVADAAEADPDLKNDPDADTGHEEPDGDEGDNSAGHGHKGGIHVHIEGGAARDGKTSDADRLKGCEDSIKRIGRNVKRMMDRLGIKDEGEEENGEENGEKKKLPPWLQKGNDDELPEELKAHMFKKGETGDEGIPPDEGSSPSRNEGTDIPPSDEEGTLENELPAAGEGDLLEAEPAKKIGRSNMGDRQYTGDAANRVNAAMAKLIREAVSRAEMIAPGVRIPTFDAVPAEGVQKSYRQLCDFRRHVLLSASTTDKGKMALGRYTGDAIKKMSCESVGHVFIDATDRARTTNNAITYAPPTYDERRSYHNAQASRIAEINKANREFWAKQTGNVRH